MDTRFSCGACANGIAVAGCLAAAIVVPGHFNLDSDGAFEADKILLLRSIAAVVLGALAVGALFRPAMRSDSWFRAWRHSLVIPVLAVLGASLLAAALSIAPRVSFWGDYVRRQGVLTLLSDVVMFGALVSLRHRKHMIENVVTAIVAGSILPALYACVQSWGFDVPTWSTSGRVSSTAGNPNFLAAYLIMVWPLTLARAISVIQRRADNPGRRKTWRVASLLLPAAYVSLLVCQTIAIVAARGRGAWIGWAVGIVFSVSLWIVLRPRGRGRRRGLLLAACAGLAVVLLVAQARMFPQSRLGSILDTQNPTARIRVLIWQASLKPLAAYPLRSLIGYGPETTSFIFERYQGPELNRLEQAYDRVDRAHNALLDSLMTTGLLGLAALLGLWLAVSAYCFRSLGIVGTKTDGCAFFGIVIGCALAGMLMPWFVFHEFHWFALGLSAGFLGGMLVYAFASLGRHRSGSYGITGSAVLLTALFASLVSHVAEIQFAFPTAVTSLLFWMEIGLVVGIGSPSSELAREDSLSVRVVPVWLPILIVASGAWVFLVDFAAVQLPFVDGLNLVHACVPLGIVAAGLALASTDDRRLETPWHFLAAGVVAGLAVAGVLHNLDSSRAGVFANRAKQYEARQDWRNAHAAYAKAIRYEPAETHHLGTLALVLLREASSAGGGKESLVSLQQALTVAERAHTLEPVNADYVELLARVHLTWAELSPEGIGKARHVEAADDLFSEAVRRRPADPAVWNGWALLDADRGRYDRALEKLEKSSSLLERSPETDQLRAVIIRRLTQQ